MSLSCQTLGLIDLLSRVYLNVVIQELCIHVAV